MKNYDVFISCKSEDYNLARQVHDFLSRNGYNVFLADAELRIIGRAEYGEVIDEALESAKHLILLASKPEYVKSTYVKNEWRLFLEEQRCGRKTGNLLTICNGFDFAKLPISLRVFHSFTLDNYQSSIIDLLPLDSHQIQNAECNVVGTMAESFSHNSCNNLGERLSMNHDVFISYSSKKPDAAHAICHVLEENGIKCWMAPRDIPMGSKYATVITQAIKSSKGVVLVFSEAAAISPWVESEINIAFSHRKPIFPYKIEQVELENYDEFYLMLNTRHWIESYPDFRTRFNDLVQTVGRIVGVRTTQTDKSTTEDGSKSTQEPTIPSSASNEIQRLFLAAEQGDTDAHNILGYYYYSGKGVTQDYAEAIKWYLKAAEQGDRSAQCILGDCYYYGRGVAQDYAEAAKWYLKAAEQGLPDAQYKLGDCYYSANGVIKDVDDEEEEAVKWFRKAAEQGDADAQKYLGDCYYFGHGVKENNTEALKWYRKAAEQGNAKSQSRLGSFYFLGVGVKKDYTEAVKWYRKAAEQGYAEAQIELGDCYYFGHGVKKDYTEALKWYRKAAEQGDADGQYNLGRFYYEGEGVAQDYAEAVKWYRKAAEQGHEEAQYELGFCYQWGDGVKKDVDEAIKWYRKAAEQGNTLAEDELADLGVEL